MMEEVYEVMASSTVKEQMDMILTALTQGSI